MSVAPTEESKASTGSLNASSTSLVISKESGVVLVHPDGKKLPESFEYVEPKKGGGMYEDYEYKTKTPFSLEIILYLCSQWQCSSL